MIIRVNDQSREVVPGLALVELLRDLGLAERKGVAVAINDEVAPRSTWPARILAASDHVLVIQATQGG